MIYKIPILDKFDQELDLKEVLNETITKLKIQKK